MTHGTDRLIWAYMEPLLLPDERELVKQWLKTNQDVPLDKEPTEVLVLDSDRSIGWQNDEKWEEKMEWLRVLPEQD